MNFVSYGFILFLAVLFVSYYLIPKRFQWMLLLAASYLFYSFAGFQYLGYILLTTLSTWLASLFIQQYKNKQSDYLKQNKQDLSRDQKRAYKAAIKKRQRRWMTACLLLNFGLLAVLKYGNFTIENLNSVMTGYGSPRTLSFMSLALPLGISFYTFQTMGYLIDVYRGKYDAQKNVFKLALFVSFFPQLIQGPISRYDDLSQTLFSQHEFNRHNISYGLQRILWGFFKKLVIADRIMIGVVTIISEPDLYQGSYVLIGMVFYAVQLYADFTGGIDITIGIAQVLGIKVTENFQRPFFAKSIVEYWRRWHITLGTWFKDYLFYPLSVSKPMLKLSSWSRKRLGDAIGKRIPVYLATTLVWLTTGIWHGASWNFVAWGLANCAVILISQEMIPLYRWFHRTFPVQGTFGFKLFQITRMFWIMSSIRIFDCYWEIGTAFRMYGSIFTRFQLSVFTDGSLLQLGLSAADYTVLTSGIMLMTGVSLLQRKGSVRDRFATRPYVLRYAVYAGTFIGIIVLGAYGVGYDATQFIYNQF